MFAANMSDSHNAQRLEQRVTELEIKVTHQDRLLETLNQVVIEQRTEIEAMRRSLEEFEQAVKNMNEDAPNEPPPHY